MFHLTPRLSRALFCGLTCLSALAVQAGPHRAGGYYAGGHSHYHGGGGRWIAPALIGGVLIGAAIASPAYAAPPAYPAYVATPVYPAYTVTYPASVVTYGVPMRPQPVGYFCPTAGQFYPYVPTCNVPWQLL